MNAILIRLIVDLVFDLVIIDQVYSLMSSASINLYPRVSLLGGWKIVSVIPSFSTGYTDLKNSKTEDGCRASKCSKTCIFGRHSSEGSDQSVVEPPGIHSALFPRLDSRLSFFLNILSTAALSICSDCSYIILSVRARTPNDCPRVADRLQNLNWNKRPCSWNWHSKKRWRHARQKNWEYLASSRNIQEFSYWLLCICLLHIPKPRDDMTCNAVVPPQGPQLVAARVCHVCSVLDFFEKASVKTTEVGRAQTPLRVLGDA